VKRLFSLFLSAVLALAPSWALADLRASSGGFGPINATSGSVSSAVTGLPTLVAAPNFVTQSGPNDATEDTIATITVPANTMGANGGILVEFACSLSGAAAARTIKAKFGGTTLLTYSSAATPIFVSFRLWIGNQNATNAQVAWFSGANGASGAINSSAAATAAIDTTAQTTIVITFQKSAGSDVMQLNGIIPTVYH
jgi:hypothetical protein